VGQTREHVHIARSAGIKQLAVVVTKLDTCAYDQARFAEIQGVLGPFLQSCGYAKPQWLPVSAPGGENVCQPPCDARLAAWWPEGRTLVDALDAFAPALQQLGAAPRRNGALGMCSARGAGGMHGLQAALAPRGVSSAAQEPRSRADSACAVQSCHSACSSVMCSSSRRLVARQVPAARWRPGRYGKAAAFLCSLQARSGRSSHCRCAARGAPQLISADPSLALCVVAQSARHTPATFPKGPGLCARE
jgi:hypothetical protein